MSDEGEASYDEWLEAIEAGEGYYLECREGHGSLPPRVVCPDCGEADLEREPLPESGEVLTHTVTHVPTPDFEDDAPYAVAVVDLGPVRMTGHVRGLEPAAVETGLVVGPTVESRETTGEPLVVFRPR